MNWPPLTITTEPRTIVLQQDPTGPPEPRLRMYSLFLAFGPAFGEPGYQPVTQEEYDALMVLVKRIMNSIPRESEKRSEEGKTQVTPQGLEIPVPTRDEFFGGLERSARAVS